MKRFTRGDSFMRKTPNARRVEELEQEKKALQIELEELKQKSTTRAVSSRVGSANVDEDYLGKLNNLEEQVLQLRKKLEGQSLLLKHKQSSDEAINRLQDEICKIKAQKVELQRKIKQEAVQLRTWKALQEKESLQLRKDKRKVEYERQKLLVFNERLKMVLQRKTEEASMATKWLKNLSNSRSGNANDQRLQAIMHHVDVTEQLNEVHSQCELQIEERVRLAEEAAKFKEEADMLMQQKLWCLLQDREADCKEKDVELKTLNEKVVELNSLVEELNIRNQGITHAGKSEASLALQTGTMAGMIASKPELSGLDTANSENNEPGSGSHSQDSSYGRAVNMALNTCCTCSKKSLCKTNKCRCRAAGGNCGISCGCTSAKCTNRETMLAKESETERLFPLYTKPLSEIGNTEVMANAAGKLNLGKK